MPPMTLVISGRHLIVVVVSSFTHIVDSLKPDRERRTVDFKFVISNHTNLFSHLSAWILKPRRTPVDAKKNVVMHLPLIFL